MGVDFIRKRPTIYSVLDLIGDAFNFFEENFLKHFRWIFADFLQFNVEG